MKTRCTGAMAGVAGAFANLGVRVFFMLSRIGCHIAGLPIYTGMLRVQLTALLLLFAGWPLMQFSIAALLLHVTHIPYRWLNLPPVGWRGTINYGLYLWQQLRAFGLQPQPARFLPFALVLACFSYYFIERPAMRIEAKQLRAACVQSFLNNPNKPSTRPARLSVPASCLSIVLQSAVLIGAVSSICSAQSLRQEGQNAGVLIGTAVRPSQLPENAYASTLAREFSMVEAEDAMKWWVLRPKRNSYDFRQGDEVVRFAQAHQMKIRGHCLVWARNNPDWLAHGHYTSKQLARLMREHIFRVMKHYENQVFAWDAINEALDENGELRDSIWYNEPGMGLAAKRTAYIAQVFRWAHQADPHALLFYNEAEGEGLNRKSDAIYAMVSDFKHSRVPINGIGLQMHVPLDANIGAIAANIARLTALHLQVHITELDVSLPVNSKGQPSAGDLKLQADIYRGIVRACLNAAGCTAIQTWGFTDKYSWIGSHSRGARGYALPFDRNYQPKAAYRAVLEELSGGRSETTSIHRR